MLKRFLKSGLVKSRAYADTTHGTYPNYRIMDYVTKSWKFTHLDVAATTQA